MTQIATPRRKRRTPLQMARTVTAHRRLEINDRILATLLAGVAGAVNAGGLFVVAQYTSHMTGYLSQLADNIVLGNFEVVWGAALALLSFVSGAAISAMLVNCARLHSSPQQYAWPIALQGTCLFGLGLAGVANIAVAHGPLLIILCLVMGLQNATVSKLSRTRIRTTHVTGLLTDTGIEIGRALFGLLLPQSGVRADATKFKTLSGLIAAYLLGGITGAIGFSRLGLAFALPFAVVLLVLSLPTLLSRRT
jgi:uncharacterized membrane protein YoaK (UPF0700 family)